MGLESANFIQQLVATNPTGSDGKSQGDDHIRLIKDVLKQSFPTVSAATRFEGWHSKFKGLRHITTTGSLAATDDGLALHFNPSGGAIVWNLLPASGNAGFTCFIQRNAHVNNVTLHPSGTNELNDVNADLVLKANCSGILHCDGTEWKFFALFLGAALAADVLTGTDTTLGVTSDALAALWEQGSDVASTGALSLGEGGSFVITGTTTINTITWNTVKNGRFAFLRFSGALQLTHSANLFLNNNGGNITTQANDFAVCVRQAGVTRLVLFRANGSALQAPAAPPITQEAVSGELTITSGGASTFTHGLGATPKIVQFELVCKSADAGYEVNDRVVISGNTSGNNRGMTPTINSTQVQANWGSAGQPMELIDESSGNTIGITPGDWRLVIRAFA